MAESELLPAISLHGLSRARSTIEDFCKSYLPLHGLEPGEGLFRFLDAFVYVSASLYELDEANELACFIRDWKTSPEEGLRRNEQPAAHTSEHATSEPEDNTISDGLRVLRAALEGRGLLSARAASELDAGAEYWRLERTLTRRLARGEALDRRNVMRAHCCKSFDYRVLHAVLHSVLGKAEDAVLFSYCAIDERLVDIGDDLTDYEDDVHANTFNLWRCLLVLALQSAGGARVEAAQAARQELFSMISELERELQSLKGKLTEEQQRLVEKRHAEASAVSRSELWVIPPPLWDECAYRASVDEAERSGKRSRE